MNPVTLKGKVIQECSIILWEKKQLYIAVFGNVDIWKTEVK